MKECKYAISYIGKFGEKMAGDKVIPNPYFDDFESAVKALKYFRKNTELDYRLNYAHDWNCGCPTKLIKIDI